MQKATDQPPSTIGRTIAIWALLAVASLAIIGLYFTIAIVCALVVYWIGMALFGLFEASGVLERWAGVIFEALQQPAVWYSVILIFLLLVLIQLCRLRSRYPMGGRSRVQRRLFAGIDWMISDQRPFMVLCAALILTALTALVVGALTGWRLLPEVWADWIGTIVGVMSTPFFLEASFIFIGISIVVAINHWRQKREGDDFVELDIKDSED